LIPPESYTSYIKPLTPVVSWVGGCGNKQDGGLSQIAIRTQRPSVVQPAAARLADLCAHIAIVHVYLLYLSIFGGITDAPSTRGLCADLNANLPNPKGVQFSPGLSLPECAAAARTGATAPSSLGLRGPLLGGISAACTVLKSSSAARVRRGRTGSMRSFQATRGRRHGLPARSRRRQAETTAHQ